MSNKWLKGHLVSNGGIMTVILNTHPGNLGGKRATPRDGSQIERNWTAGNPTKVLYQPGKNQINP